MNWIVFGNGLLGVSFAAFVAVVLVAMLTDKRRPR